MGDTRSRRKPDWLVAASKGAAKSIVKAAAGEKKAAGKLAETSRTLRVALDALAEANPGSSGEKKARRAARAAIDGLIAAKRKLKKAQKKLTKTAARQTKPKAQTKATATAKPKPGPTVASSSKLRKASALPPTMKPNEKKVEDRKVPKAAAKTNSDSVAGGRQPDETARLNL